ncbi:MAG TPA: rhodanese-like domain-containing protein [Ktedonobacteraceae bacterium]
MFRNFFSKPAVSEVSAEEARAKQQAGAVIVDVREPYELREGYIPGAVHMPLRSLSPRMKELDPSKEIVVVCRSGNRSITAVQFLQQGGFTQVSSLAGGMIGWTRKRFPVQR